MAFYAVLLAFLAGLSAGRVDPARAVRDSWWPAQRAPRGFVTARVRGVPAPPPAAPALTVDMREEMLSASLAGLAALADRLQARGIRVVRPDELLHRIRHERAAAGR